MITGSDTIM